MQAAMLDDWMECWMECKLQCWLECWLAASIPVECWLERWLQCWLAGWLECWLAGCNAGWKAGWNAGCDAGAIEVMHVDVQIERVGAAPNGAAGVAKAAEDRDAREEFRGAHAALRVRAEAANPQSLSQLVERERGREAEGQRGTAWRPRGGAGGLRGARGGWRGGWGGSWARG